MPLDTPQDDLPSGLVPGRECGDCLACCQVFPIDEPGLQKPAGMMCAHAFAGGCGIYESRPGACRRFHCLWRQAATLPDSARPDRLGVVFWVTGRPQPQTVFENLYVAGTAINDPRALDQAGVQAIVEMLSTGGALPIFLHWGGQEYLIHPRPEMADALLHPLTTPHRDWLEPARTWLARYAPIARQYAASRAFLPAGH